MATSAAAASAIEAIGILSPTFSFLLLDGWDRPFASIFFLSSGGGFAAIFSFLAGFRFSPLAFFGFGVGFVSRTSASIIARSQLTLFSSSNISTFPEAAVAAAVLEYGASSTSTSTGVFLVETE